MSRAGYGRLNTGSETADNGRMGSAEVAGFGAVHRTRLLAAAFMGNLLPVAVATATDFGSHRTVFFLGAAGACAAPLIVILVPRRHRLLFYAGAYGGLPCMAALQAYSGGPASGYSVLLMMPLIWFGLQATDRELVAAGLVLAACSYLPMLVFGPPAYPVSWGHASLLVLIGGAVSGSLRTLSRETTRLTNRLRREAVVDDLTGLLNRRGWEVTARRELARASRADMPVALVTMDLDGLKELNDAQGHEEGDRVLRETGDRLRRALRATDVVARLGGDEFAALLTESRLDDALGALQRLQTATPPQGAFSAGVATWNGGTEQLADLLRRADVALYAAKTSGGATTEIAPQTFDPHEEAAADEVSR
jgi:diguanylate cyclase (GGDEF)-like protein